MKRIILCFALVFSVMALAQAQGNNRWGPGFGPGGQYPQGRGQGPQRQQQQPESTSVSGNLTIVQGMIAVAGDDATYLVRGLDRYVGFIDGLKEGAAVTLEGFAMPARQGTTVQFFQVQKMTLNDKDYDLARPQRNNSPRQQPGPGPRQMHQQQQHRHWGMW